jgi:hypothetical protein
MSEKKKKSKLDKAAEIAEKLPMAGAGAIAGLGGYAGYELSKLNKFRKQQDALRRAAHMQRFEQARNKRLNPNMVGGLEGQNIVQGGGGFGNLTQFGKGKELPKKNMKKGGKVKKNKKPKGCGIARQGVRKAKMITMKGS